VVAMIACFIYAKRRTAAGRTAVPIDPVVRCDDVHGPHITPVAAARAPLPTDRPPWLIRRRRFQPTVVFSTSRRPRRRLPLTDIAVNTRRARWVFAGMGGRAERLYPQTRNG